ncbi:MAG: archease [Syntrophobacter sp.]
MPYRFLEEIATADVAFEAWGETLGEMFTAAADATMNTMVADLEAISPTESRRIDIRADAIDMLLFNFLQEIIYYKDADEILLRVSEVTVSNGNGAFCVSSKCRGERIDPGKHDLIVDVKAVTLHRFKVEQTARGWEALVILDV